jgi:hypothetical protein
MSCRIVRRAKRLDEFLRILVDSFESLGLPTDLILVHPNTLPAVRRRRNSPISLELPLSLER